MYNRQPCKVISLAMTEQDSGEDQENDDGEESEEEDPEDIEAVVEKLLTIREKCHLKAKENIDSALEK